MLYLYYELWRWHVFQNKKKRESTIQKVEKLIKEENKDVGVSLFQ